MKGYRILLWKKYFDTGYGLTNYLFKLIAVFGLTTQKFKTTFIVLFLYTIACFLLGRLWLYSRLADTETEISNIFNPFVYDVRKKLKIKERQGFK